LVACLFVVVVGVDVSGGVVSVARLVVGLGDDDWGVLCWLAGLHGLRVGELVRLGLEGVVDRVVGGECGVLVVGEELCRVFGVGGD
jgi:hypothetical protein